MSASVFDDKGTKLYDEDKKKPGDSLGLMKKIANQMADYFKVWADECQLIYVVDSLSRPIGGPT